MATENLFDELISKVTLMNMLTSLNDYDGYMEAKKEAASILNCIIDDRIEYTIKRLPPSFFNQQ